MEYVGAPQYSPDKHDLSLYFDYICNDLLTIYQYPEEIKIIYDTL